MQEQENKELLANLVTVNVKYTFTDEERLQKSSQIAQLINDIEHEKLEKKANSAEYKNKIDKLEAEAKLISGHITNGFTFVDKPAELWLDYDRSFRTYLDKQDGSELKSEPFHASDYQKKIDFNDLQDIIDENNDAGEYAETGYKGKNGSLIDIHPADLAEQFKSDPGAKVLDGIVKDKIKAFKESKNNR